MEAWKARDTTADWQRDAETKTGLSVRDTYQRRLFETLNGARDGGRVYSRTTYPSVGPRQKFGVNWQPCDMMWWQKQEPGNRRPGFWACCYHLLTMLMDKPLHPNKHDFKICKSRVIICLLNRSAMKPNQKVKAKRLHIYIIARALD